MNIITFLNRQKRLYRLKKQIKEEALSAREKMLNRDILINAIQMSAVR